MKGRFGIVLADFDCEQSIYGIKVLSVIGHHFFIVQTTMYQIITSCIKANLIT